MFFLCCKGKEGKQQVKNKASGTAAVSYTKEDLQKIKWIEGKWKGMAEDEPFYEVYRFMNDSTIEITMYEWDGKDSSNTSRNYLFLKDGVYYLGEQLNWKTTSITEKEIRMAPNQNAFNDIVWKHPDNKGWDAILTGKKSILYHMTPFDPFKK